MRRALAMVVAVGVCAGIGSAQTEPPVLRPFIGPPDEHQLDLSRLVPGNGRADAVWYVPAGKTVPQVAVAWHFRDRRPVLGWDDRRRYVLTLWSPVRLDPGESRWVPHTLIRASPFALVGRAVRLADVTRDGHADLLVTVLCSDCNHDTAVASVYATFGREVRRIYGRGQISVLKARRGHDAYVEGRPITETPWGARDGLVWFDLPGGGTSVCCPAYRLQTFMRWGPGGWHVVARRRVRPEHDLLGRQGWP